MFDHNLAVRRADNEVMVKQAPLFVCGDEASILTSI